MQSSLLYVLLEPSPGLISEQHQKGAGAQGSKNHDALAQHLPCSNKDNW